MYLFLLSVERTAQVIPGVARTPDAGDPGSIPAFRRCALPPPPRLVVMHKLCQIFALTPPQVGLLRQLLEQEPQREQETRPAAEHQLQELGAPISVRRRRVLVFFSVSTKPTLTLNPSSLTSRRSYHSSSRSSSRGRSHSRSSRYS